MIGARIFFFSVLVVFVFRVALVARLLISSIWF